jgi:hypothetical protein
VKQHIPRTRLSILGFFILFNYISLIFILQDHYDFGLRSIKSMLLLAGQHKRTNPRYSKLDILTNVG